MHLHGHLTETDTAADIRCIIITGIENWFLTGDERLEHCRRTVEQIGWFQEVLKVKVTYRLPKSGRQGKSVFESNSSHHRHTAATNSNSKARPNVPGRFQRTTASRRRRQFRCLEGECV
jgi:hypothetical protein